MYEEQRLPKAASLDKEAIKTLERKLQGALVRPEDAAYDDARAVWNGMIDRQPALIARC